MTPQEFSNEFDVLYNSITNGNAPGVTEYEKSVFLTRAQLQFIQELIKGNTVYGQGVEDTTNVKLQLYPLYIQCDYDAFIISLNNLEVLHILNIETTIDGKTLPTVPISYDEYSIIKNNPFKFNEKRAYYIHNKNTAINKDWISIYYKSQLVSTPKCLITYIKYPTPIITDATITSNTIDNNIGGTLQDCVLPKSTHFEILKIAVQLALSANGITQ